MGKQKWELPPPWHSKRSCSAQRCWSDATLTVYQVKLRKNVCILSTVHTGVGTFSGAKAKPESENGKDVPDQMARAYSVKDGKQRWPVAVFYNILDLAGIRGHIAFKECTSSRRAQRKFLQQLSEELRAEYIKGKGATAVGPMWTAAKAATAAAADMDTDTEAVPVRKSCKRNNTLDTWNATSLCLVTVQGERR